MKRFFLLAVFFLTCSSLSFGITVSKLKETINEISTKCFPQPVNFKITLLPVIEFENARMSEDISYADAENIVTFVKSFRYSDNDKYAWGEIVLRKEILDMSDDFFDQHYAHFIAHEFCHIYKETYYPAEDDDHGKIFISVQHDFNERLKMLPASYQKYKQILGDGFYDSALADFFNSYR